VTRRPSTTQRDPSSKGPPLLRQHADVSFVAGMAGSDAQWGVAAAVVATWVAAFSVIAPLLDLGRRSWADVIVSLLAEVSFGVAAVAAMRLTRIPGRWQDLRGVTPLRKSDPVPPMGGIPAVRRGGLYSRRQEGLMSRNILNQAVACDVVVPGRFPESISAC